MMGGRKRGAKPGTFGHGTMLVLLAPLLACSEALPPPTIEREVSLEDLQKWFEDIDAIRDQLSGGASAMTAGSSDTIPPRLVSATTDADGSDVILKFSEPVTVPEPIREIAEDWGLTLFYRALFSITIEEEREVTMGATMDGDTVLTVLLTTPWVREGDEVTVAYDNLFVEAVPGFLVDTAGNPLASFAAWRVRNNSRSTGDEVIPVPVMSADLTVREGNSTTITTVLAEEPDDTVMMYLLYFPPNAVRTNPTSLTFTPEDWDDAQTITASALQDADTLSQWGIIFPWVTGIDRTTTRDAFIRFVVTDDDGSGP